MKRYIIIIILLEVSNLCYCQESNLNKEKVIFIDECSNEIMQADYKISSWELNGRMVRYSSNRGIWKTGGLFISGTKIDTIRIEKIGLFTRSEKGKEVKAYLNCEKICNGIEIDYHANGTIRMEGNFKSGMPIETKVFEDDGRIIQHITYFPNSFIPKTERNFDLDGGTLSYSIYEVNDTKVIIKNYDKNDKLIGVETVDIAEYK